MNLWLAGGVFSLQACLWMVSSMQFNPPENRGFHIFRVSVYWGFAFLAAFSFGMAF